MSKQRYQKPKPENTSHVDDSILITTILDGTDSESLPFPEWSDQDLNLEKWDTTIKLDKATAGSRLNILPGTHNTFEDPQEVHLPPSIGVHQWKRCSEIFSDVSFSVFVNKPTYPDLVTPNQHLLKSEFYRSFITSVETLLYISSCKPFPDEYGSPGHYASTDRAWRPWHHIYSNCKIVKGYNEHTPLYNNYGKYVVRLYWMGSWRKIYVDDYFPVDKTNSILLPSLQIPKAKSQQEVIEGKTEKRRKDQKAEAHGKKDVVEIWPMLLCKALLKLGSLSWCTGNELNDFDIINCLTGWVPQKVKTKNISSSELWDIFMAYVDRFEWEEVAGESAKRPGSSKSKAKKNEKQEIQGRRSRMPRMAIPSSIENMQAGDRYVVAFCDKFEDNAEPKNKLCGVFLSQVRDTPFIKPPPRPELEFWKIFRYEEWAVKQGIISPDIPKLNIKSLRIVDPFKRIYNITHELEDPKDKSQVNLDTETIDKKSVASSKSSKKDAVKSVKNRLQPDPSMWMDFDDLVANISYVQIYFQPRCFKDKAKISDINFLNKTTDFKHIISPIDLKIRNEPIYLFMDSIDSKFLVLNFAQVGNLKELEKHVDDVESVIPQRNPDSVDICVEIMLKKTGKDEGEETLTASQMANKSMRLCRFNTKPVTFALEEYCWHTNTFGKNKVMIRTYGSESMMIDLKQGRKAFRLWTSSHCPYVLQVFSDTAMTIGYLDEFISASMAESQLLINLCYEFSSCFGKLVQSFGASEYALSLRNFYQCYKPIENLTKNELVTVHNALFEEFCSLINKNSSSPNSLPCIRLLFLQLKTFDYINPYRETPHICPEDICSLQVQIDYIKKMQRAAVIIQAFFKGVYIRQLMKKRNEEHRQYFAIFDTLKKVYQEIFSSEKRLDFCPNLFRSIFERKDMQNVKEKFEIYKDIESVLDLHTYNDSILVNNSGWVGICRYEFHINSIEPIIVKINLFCNVKNYYVRVFNNDTGVEIKRYTNNVLVEKYESNVLGYTILCYGYAEENTKIYWKLALASKKMSRTDMIIIPTIPIKTVSLKNHYIPSCGKTICKYILKVNMDTFLTAHLRATYDQVQICLKLKEPNGKILYETMGVGSALLPVLHLRCIPKDGKDISNKSRPSIQSDFSDITYSKLNPNGGDETENTSLRSTSQKKVLVDVDVPEVESKWKRKSSEISDSDGDTLSITSQYSERSKGASGRHIHRRKSKTHQNDLYDSDPLSSKSSLKKFTEKLNKGSILTIRKSRQESLSKVIETLQTEYILEAIVVKDSWPLTSEEWHQVHQLREMDYLNLLGERKTPISKKSLLVNKRAECPYWILDLMHSVEDSLEYDLDRTKAKKIIELKGKWFSDAERYRRGLELRKKYLEENLATNDDVITDKTIRTNDPNDFAVTIVREQSIEEFMIMPSETIDEDTCKTKCFEDYLIHENNVERMLREYKDKKKVIKDGTEKLLLEQTRRIELLNHWFADVRSDSAIMIADAVKLEKDYVKKMLESTTKVRVDKKGKAKKFW